MGLERPENGCSSDTRITKGDIVLVEYGESVMEGAFLIASEIEDWRSIVVLPVYGIDEFTEDELRIGTPGVLFIWEGWITVETGYAHKAQFVDHRPLWLSCALMRAVRKIGRVIDDRLWAGVITESHLVGLSEPIEGPYARTLQSVNEAFTLSMFGR